MHVGNIGIIWERGENFATEITRLLALVVLILASSLSDIFGGFFSCGRWLFLLVADSLSDVFGGFSPRGGWLLFGTMNS